ncbi:MAG: hypothetical protein ONB44_07810 [candidate division KSB1 bacterium]|nr:hypothetical protein [candidate division KSB1 bacterium]MDZ7302032.1 hypothetical protein [candidate division KSB1 bacterium]MDZ7311075.1 hypothetical protein [candidate division KSB1 bacterium]
MTLGQKLMAQLTVRQQMEAGKRLPTDSVGGTRGSLIEDEMDGIHLQAEIQDFDKFSYMVKTISATRLQPPASNAPIKDLLLRQSGEIERRVSYLLENFRLVELDEVNGVAQMRSAAPYHKNEEISYYEIILREGKSLRFSRYRQQNRTAERENVPSHLTQEIFERLADDLSAALRLG